MFPEVTLLNFKYCLLSLLVFGPPGKVGAQRQAEEKNLEVFRVCVTSRTFLIEYAVLNIHGYSKIHVSGAGHKTAWFTVVRLSIVEDV